MASPRRDGGERTTAGGRWADNVAGGLWTVADDRRRRRWWLEAKAATVRGREVGSRREKCVSQNEEGKASWLICFGLWGHFEIFKSQGDKMLLRCSATRTSICENTQNHLNPSNMVPKTQNFRRRISRQKLYR